MAMSWLNVLKAVPWNDVINNAPKIADGAKQLLRSIGKKTQGRKEAASTKGAFSKPESVSLEEMDDRITVVESSLNELESQMLSSAEIIKKLCEQNSELIKRIELNRIRNMWLAVGAVFVMLIAAVSLGIAVK